MTGRLVPGANAALTAENPGLDAVVVGIAWDQIASRGPSAELVPVAIVCDADGRVLSDDDLVFFNQIESADSSVRYLDESDQEEIDVDLVSVPDVVDKIVFAVYLDPDPRSPRDLGSVRSMTIRVSAPDGRELVQFPLPSERNHTIDAVILGELYRHRAEWKFRAVGQGYTTGLTGLRTDHGIGRAR
ncbi:TerD family protein [Curtobacterium sp. PhB115]|uniref:TerD family protein n=1 Tax=Curtobacterium sp. PhB115 TaxID=2485173 RepID=UPI000F4D0B0C|nr:TerD family protein [Curtobacterium sp. PhB115]ROP66706.1 tellurium resistance protein TerD [Curtobacterium sp. PhB115]